MSRDYAVIKADFVAWRRLPPVARKPRTLTLFAAEHGVSRKVLHDWLNDPSVKKAISSVGINMFSCDEIARGREAFMQQVFNGNVAAFKEMCRLSGIVPTEPSDNEDEYDLSKMSLEELAELASDAEPEPEGEVPNE